jgi:DNA mismatch endonuclease (patch repair protein)
MTNIMLGYEGRPMRYDPLSPSERSERMSKIRPIDTKPEMLVRRIIHGMGFRYRLHVRTLPGHPDLVFRSRKKVIFVHGCFWHQHGCNQYRMPKTKQQFWETKLASNAERDRVSLTRLTQDGWSVLVVWECQMRNTDALKSALAEFLGEK